VAAQTPAPAAAPTTPATAAVAQAVKPAPAAAPAKPAKRAAAARTTEARTLRAPKAAAGGKRR
jgi:hypothetical protein